jgi:hypothetical protein
VDGGSSVNITFPQML